MTNNDWTPDQPLVSIHDVHKSFGDLEVLKGVSLDVMKGEVICVPGAINLAATLAGRATPKWLLRRVSGLVGRYSAKS